MLLEKSDHLSKCHVHKDFLTYKMQKLALPLITFYQDVIGTQMDPFCLEREYLYFISY